MLTGKTPDIFPPAQQFTQRFGHGLSQLVWTVVPADLDTPVAAMLRLMEKDKPCFLLESVEKGEIRGRYSVIGIAPDLIWRCKDGKVEIAHSEVMDDLAFIPSPDAPLDSFRKLLDASKIDIPEGLPPMSAGVVGYMGYDMVREMEQLPEGKTDTTGIPDSCYIRPKIMVIFDAVTDSMFVVATIWADEKRTDAAAAYEAAKKRIHATLEKLAQPIAPPAKKAGVPVHINDFESNTTRAHYDGMIERAREYIRAGDIFQVVLSHRQTIPFALPSFAFYRALRRLNPSPFMFYYDFGGGLQVVGASPEILVRLRDGIVTVRPIAGTRPRGASPVQDQANEAELKQDPKERAEHLMLLDLGRNDVGRVAKEGSVRVTAQAVVERYSHVMHLVSNVEGDLAAGLSALDAFFAGFPAGTVSGAPKVRAMQIIDELEPERRGFYAGGVGYFGADGNMDTAICLRTAVLLNGQLHVQAGAGIVYDSDPDKEWEETLAKAQAIIRAAELAHRYATGLDG